MENNTNESTLTVQGFTPYAQVPVWVIRSGKELSHGARALYACIMTYADNSNKSAFPSRQRLAEDLGCTEKSISRYVKELEDFGALDVDRRRNKRTGNFYANNYTLVFENPIESPRDKKGTPPKDTSVPITKPTSLTTPTNHFTVEQSSTDTFHEQPTAAHEKSSPKTYDDHLPKEQWNYLKRLLQLTGEAVRDTEVFYSPLAQDMWEDFEMALEEHTIDLPYADLILDLVQNGKWTVNARVADWYEAGKELNTLFNTAKAM